MLVHHKPTKILVVAESGSGKTTYVIRYVKNSRHKLKIIFDHKLEFLERENLQPFYNRHEMLDAIIKGQALVSYNHLEEFPGDAQSAFQWICEWTYEIGRRLQKPLLFTCDEVNRFTGNNTNDWEFMQTIEDGRLWGIDFIGTSHGANNIHNRLRAQLTEIVAMRTEEKLPLQWLEDRGFDPDEVSNLDIGQYVLKAKNKFVRGRLFSVDSHRDSEDEHATGEESPQQQGSKTYEGSSNGSGSSSSSGGAGGDAIEPVSNSPQQRES